MAGGQYKGGVEYRCQECGKIWIGDPYTEPICPRCGSDNVKKRP